jgi:plastocyanin
MIVLCVIILSMVLAAGAMAERAGVASTQPTAMNGATTAPSTMPTVQIIRGTVDFQGLTSLQKPRLNRVVVYLASNPALDALPVPTAPYTVAQRDRAFVPNFIVVPKGAFIDFPNWDHFDHNVFSRSAAAPAFDLDRYPYGYSKTKQFDKVGVVQIFCNIHPFMRAIILVTPNMIFTRADANGNFELTGMPPGKYEMVAWNDRTGEERQTIEITAGATAEVAMHLSENREAVMQNDPPNHESGYGVGRGLGEKRETLGLPIVEGLHPASQPSASASNQ